MTPFSLLILFLIPPKILKPMNEGTRDEGRGHEGMRARGKTEGYEIEEGKARENTHSGWAGGRLVSFFLHILN